MFQRLLRYVAPMWFIILAGLVLMGCLLVLLIGGCTDPMVEGIAIGVGASEVGGEGQELATSAKERLIAEVLALRLKLENAPDLVVVHDLQEKLAAAEKKLSIATMTETAADKVNEALGKDWGNKEKLPDNMRWLLEAGLAVFGVSQLRRKKQLEAGISRYEGQANRQDAELLHDTIKGFTKKVWT